MKSLSMLQKKKRVVKNVVSNLDQTILFKILGLLHSTPILKGKNTFPLLTSNWPNVIKLTLKMLGINLFFATKQVFKIILFYN